MKELCVSFDETAATVRKNSAISISLCGFLQYSLRVKLLRIEGTNNYDIARILHQAHGEPDYLAIFPALEEIELGKNSLLTDEG